MTKLCSDPFAVTFVTYVGAVTFYYDFSRTEIAVHHDFRHRSRHRQLRICCRARNPRRGPAFCLRDIGCVTTASSINEEARLLTIYQQITEVIGAHHPNIIAIERVFHNKNISNSLSVAKCIRVVQLSAAQAGIPVELLTPQQLKKATELGGPKNR